MSYGTTWTTAPVRTPATPTIAMLGARCAVTRAGPPIAVNDAPSLAAKRSARRAGTATATIVRAGSRDRTPRGGRHVARRRHGRYTWWRARDPAHHPRSGRGGG